MISKLNKQQKSIWLIFLMGLLLRFVLMPFALQADLISIAYRASLMTEKVLLGFDMGQNLAHYIYAFTIWLFKSFFNHSIFAFFAEPFGTIAKPLTSSVGNWLNFVENEQINALLFVLKIPHLLADLAVFWLIAKAFKKEKNKNIALLLWWFNPVNLYAFYVFSRHDSLTLLAMALTLITLSQEKIIKALVSFVAAIEIRFQPMLYAPLIAIHFLKNIKAHKQLIKKLTFAILIIASYFFLQKQLPLDQVFLDKITPQQNIVETVREANPEAEKQNLLGKAIGLATSVGGKTQISKLAIFTLLYGSINLIYLFVKKGKNQQEKLTQLSAILYLGLASYFLVNDFSPHYYVWLSLFATLSLGIKNYKKFLIGYLISILGWGLMGLMSTDNYAITQNLFLPISPLIFNTPQIGYSLSFAPQLAILGKAIFALGLIYSSWQIISYFIPQLEKRLVIAGFKLFLVSFPILQLIYPKAIKAAKYPLYNNQERYTASDKQELKVGEIYFENFTSPVPEFSAIDLRFDTSRNTQSQKILFRLKEKGQNEWLVENEYDIVDFYNRAYYPFGFPPTDASNGKAFVFELELLPSTSDNPNNLPLYIYPRDYTLSTEKATSELLVLIKKDLVTHIQEQPYFFTFYFTFLIINLLAILFIFTSPWLLAYHEKDVKN